VAWGRALRRRCPQCGEGRLFRGYARLEGACAVCGLVYRREAGAQTGSMYMTAAVTQVVAATVIALAWILTDMGLGTFLLISVPLVLGFCLWFLPVSQSLWVAIEYVTDVNNGEEWVQPRP
jgi:uncharacterized protein (DUF983 family)